MNREHLLRGAEREAAVVSDLFKKGFEVFPAFGTGSSCDMIALKHGELLRVEVKGSKHGTQRRKTAHPSGPVASLGHGSKDSDCRLFDIHISVLDSGEILYQRSALHVVNKASAELPLREDYSKHTTKKNLERALSMTEK
jgi:hypothetical protein